MLVHLLTCIAPFFSVHFRLSLESNSFCFSIFQQHLPSVVVGSDVVDCVTGSVVVDCVTFTVVVDCVVV